MILSSSISLQCFLRTLFFGLNLGEYLEFKIYKQGSTRLQKDMPQPLNQEGSKHTDCPYYVECLTYAANQRWYHWSCGKCQNYTLRLVYERRQYIGEYYPMLAEIYPEFKKKYKRFMEP